jgi:hypothetical protein
MSYPASESDEVPDVLVRVRQRGAANPALRIRATGAVASCS